MSKSELTACSIYGDCSQPRLNLVSVGDKNGVVSLWTPETTVKLKTHSESISSLEFYGSQVVTASPDGHIRSIDLERLVLQDVFDATKHFSDTTSNPGMITWHKAKSNTQVYVENGNGTILLYDVMANTSVTISEDGIGRPVTVCLEIRNLLMCICLPYNSKRLDHLSHFAAEPRKRIRDLYSTRPQHRFRRYADDQVQALHQDL